jgi:hypothetical protein
LSFFVVICNYGLAVVPDRVASSIRSNRTVRLANGVSSKAQPQYDQGLIDPSSKLGYITLLTIPSPSQQQALNKLLAQQQNPHSRYYHQWLTPAQYADRFGLSRNDVGRITNWLKSQGLDVLNVARGRNWITFSGTAAQIANALHTEIHRYTVDGEQHFANATKPSIPAALAGVVSGFRGLDDFQMKPMGVGNRLNPDFYDSRFNTNFIAPGDISTIYDVHPLYNAGIDGTGQRLAVAGQTDIYLADLTDFRSAFGLPAITGCTTNSNGILTACNSTNLRYVLLGTDPGVPSPGNLGETDLDLEWSGAVARNAQIIYVNGETAGGVADAFYYAIDNNLAPVISLSYGICEWGEALNGAFASDEAELQFANSEGITFFSSAGDTGAAGCDGFTNPNTNPPNLAIYGLQVNYPASSPEVTGVGGTALPYNDLSGAPFWGTSSGSDGGSALEYIPEQSWNDPLEFSAFCNANPSNSFCTSFGITTPLSAQAALGLGGGGGGASNCVQLDVNGFCKLGFAQPSWQTVTLSGTPAARFVPDVSLMASPNFPGYIFCTPLSELGGTGSTSSCANGITTAIETNNSIIGGTSVSTPVFAGIVTLLNQYLARSGSQGFGNINPTLYSLAKTKPSPFHAVNSGNNIVYCVPGTPSGQLAALVCPQAGYLGFYASNVDPSTNYNEVTGLGSVDVSQLATALGGPLPAASLSATALNFGNQVLNTTSPPQTVTLTDTGGATLTVKSISVIGANSGDFSETNNCGTSVPAGGSCTITVAFTPTVVGTRTAQVTISDNAANSPQTVGLTGVGVINATTTSLTSSPNPSALGQGVTLTAVVTPANGGTPTGKVTFYDGSTSLGTVALSLGTAQFATSALVVGTHSLTASYSGDSSFQPSTSSAVIQVVTQGTATVALGSSPNPSYLDQTVAFTATVAGVKGILPTGSVSFKQGGAVLGTVQLVNSSAVYSTAFGSSGTRSITAVYSGDLNYFGSTSKVLKQVVTKYPTNTTAASSLNPSVYGQAVNLTSQVTSAAPNQPSGTVTFKNGAASLGTVPLVNGFALLTKTNLSAGTLSITATYNGDSLNSKSTSPTLKQVVHQATSTTSVTSSPNPSAVGQNVKIKATVKSATVVPVGTVTFTAGTTTLGTVSLAGGKATLTISTLPTGKTTVTATYNGTSNITGSSGSVVQTVK